MLLLATYNLFLKVLFGSKRSETPRVNQSLNKNTSVSVISIVNIDAQYDYLMFFLLNIPFQTRKAEDFYYWCLALHLHNLDTSTLLKDVS